MIIGPINKADALSQSGELSVPLVVIRKTNSLNQVIFTGFIPGLTMKNIVADKESECKAQLKEYLMNKLKTMMQNGEPFPFFPTREEIMQDFEDVYSIEFMKIKSGSRKAN